MKKFIYQVMGYEFVDTTPFGVAWQEAKAKAFELHTAIYRLVVDGDKVRHEALVKGFCFLPVTLAPIENVMMFQFRLRHYSVLKF